MWGATVFTVEVETKKMEWGTKKSPVGWTSTGAISMNSQFHIFFMYMKHIYTHTHVYTHLKIQEFLRMRGKNDLGLFQYPAKISHTKSSIL